MGPVAALLPDGRLHLQHGPIDLVVEAIASGKAPAHARHAEERRMAARVEARGTVVRASRRPFGPPQHDEREEKGHVQAAYSAAAGRFATILDELCAELALLRSPVRRAGPMPRGVVARRMRAAVLPYAEETFVTPMAAVAGAVAEEVLAAMTAAGRLRRASVNNGGDIALHLAPGESLRIGLVDRPNVPGLFGAATLRAEDGVGGVATSGWPGRSFSLGIADAVTILARTAAEADAAATIVANAVDLPGHPAVRRAPASSVQCDSDLGERLVTRGVGPLSRSEIEEALGRGREKAEELARRGLIRAAALRLQGETVVVFPDLRHAEEPFGERRLEARTEPLRLLRDAPSALLSMTNGEASHRREVLTA